MKLLRYLFLVCAVSVLASSTALAARGGRGAPEFDEGAQLATHKEGRPLSISFKRLSSLCLHTSGNLLACDMGTGEIKVINPAGRLVGSFKPGFNPEAIDVASNGMIYCGGQGKLAIIDKNGRVVKLIEAPSSVASADTGRRRARSLETRIAGIAVSEKDVFVTFGSGWSLGAKSKLFRFDKQLDNPKMLAEGLRGCCQRCDLVFRDDVIYLAENTAHRVVKYDREGNVLGKWGARSRTELEGFGSCCNPMNLCFDKSGRLYTSESGLGRVKLYSTDGKHLGLIGYVGVDRFTQAGGFAASCSNMSIATTDGRRFYVMDYRSKKILVLDKKGR